MLPSDPRNSLIVNSSKISHIFPTLWTLLDDAGFDSDTDRADKLTCAKFKAVLGDEDLEKNKIYTYERRFPF